MKINSLTLRRAAKINLGSYENTDIDMSIHIVSDDPNDNIGNMYATAAQSMRDLMHSELAVFKVDPARYGF